MIDILVHDNDKQIGAELKQTYDVLEDFDLQQIISSFEIYQSERDACFEYRINGDIVPFFTNVLCDVDGERGYEGVEVAREFDPETELYAKELNEVLFQENGWYYYLTDDKCTKNELEPQKNRFDLLNDNWSLFLSYCDKINLNPLLFNGINISDGIAIYFGGEVEVDGKKMTYLVCPIEHNLTANETINLYDSVGLKNIYNVYKVGLNDNTFKKNVFVIDSILDYSLFLTDKYRFKKVISGVESQYYSRWFKKIPLKYDLFKAAYSKSIYADNVMSFIFKETLDLNNIIDYFKRPIMNVYVSLIKKTDNYWGNVYSGLNTYLANIDYDYNNIFEGSTINEIETIVDTATYYFGDICEYNAKTIIETRLAHSIHVFNTKNRIQNTIYESYHYNPFYELNLKGYSDTIKKDDGIITVPDYATKIDGINQWKDINLLDYPFLNKHHYLYKNFNFYVKRQDPCKKYIISNNALIDGKCIDLDKSKIVIPEKIC